MKAEVRYAQVSDTSHDCHHEELVAFVDDGWQKIQCTRCLKRWDSTGKRQRATTTPAPRPGSSVGIFCHHDQHLRDGGCPEKLNLDRVTAAPCAHDDEEDYQQMFPALDEAAVILGWRLYKSMWWCPTHVIAMNLACARCRCACPACSCMGGPLHRAVDGIVVDVTETKA